MGRQTVHNPRWALLLLVILAGWTGSSASGEEVVVTVTEAPIQAGSQVVGRVKRGDRLTVVETNGPWLKVTVPGQSRQGWINRKFVQSEPTHQESPAQPEEPAALSQEEKDRLLAEAQTLNDKALTLIGQQKYQEVIPLAQQILAIRRRVLGEKHPDTVKSLNALGQLLGQLGDYAAARPYYEQSLAIYQDTLGAKHPLTATALGDLGSLQQRMGDYPAARRCYEQALAIRKEALGEKRPEIAASLNQLGSLAKTMGDYAAARAYLEQALAIRQEIFGEDHPLTARSHNDFGVLLSQIGDYAAARSHLERALVICQETLGEKHQATARSLQNLGGLLAEMGDYAAARPYLEQSQAVYQEILGEMHPLNATLLNNLGAFLEMTGDYAAARLRYEQALAIRKTTVGDKHPDTAETLHKLGGLLDVLGDHAAARQHLEHALAIRKAALGEKNPDTAATLNSLAALFKSLRNYPAARSHYEQALLILQETLGERHRDTGSLLNNFGDLLYAMRDYPAARRRHEQALAIAKETVGAKHPSVARSLNNLGLVLDALGDSPAAIRCFEQAVAIVQESLGETHPETALAYTNLADGFDKAGDGAAAAEATDRAQQIQNRHIARVLPTLSEQEQLKFLTSTRGAFNDALFRGLRRRDDARLCALSAAWLVNGKARGQEALARSAQLTGAVAEARLAELRGVRKQLARLSLKTLPAGQTESHRTQLALLRRQEEALIRKLGELTLGAATGEDPWIPLERLREHLAPDAVHVNIACFGVFENQPQGMGNLKIWRPPRYAAWLVPPAGRGQVTIIDLGEAKIIDDAVQELRQSLQQGDKIAREHGEPAAEQQTSAPLRQLAKLIFEPLLPHLGQARRLIISPDGQLWLVPWAALLLPDGKYAVENYEISYVVSGRELVARGSQPSSPQAPLVLADPDFDLSVDQPRTTAQQVTAHDPGLRRGSVDAQQLPRFVRLPATAAEAREIAPSLQQYAGVAPQVYIGREAQESVLKSARSPQVLTLSTHGFFLHDQEVTPQDYERTLEASRSAVVTADGKVLENPLLRCGLVLAGCNRRDGLPTDADDGVLTGLEIVGVDLRGTELVVLSACETGVGEVRNGEGVAGLRQAFQLAGAEAVVASLWSVPDLETARLMSSFFEHLAAGKSKAAALRAAQLERIASRRGRSEAAHPFYWAAFTLTGI